uniref:RNA-directed RNA polymerase C-terminal domain-containing protein n=1 Tax=Riboviria sp. TaxID=2585031 RepID=A0A8K1U275_9VIRU|nr:MAG: hypothetical protein 1 [Riboviria sp.]
MEYPESVDDLDSIKVHAKLYLENKMAALEPTAEEQDYMAHVLEVSMRKACWTLRDDFDERSNFEKALWRLDFQSSPGYPYMSEKPTIGEWLGYDGVQFSPMQVDRLWFDVGLVFSGEYDIMLRSFVKQEPHNRAKVSAGRWRLIFATPLCVQVAWHMVFDPSNDAMIEHSVHLPVQQGLSLVNGQWKHYVSRWLAKGYDAGMDKSAWDWTMSEWMFDVDLEVRFRLGRGRRMREWLSISEGFYRSVYGPCKIITSTGVILKRYVWMMVSGSVNTISCNGIGQQCAHIYNCMFTGMDLWPLPSSLGDDTLGCKRQWSNLSGYERIGVRVKEIVDGLHFAGHVFDPDVGPQPSYMVKHINKFLRVSDDVLPGYLNSMCSMYANDPRLRFWKRAADKLGLSRSVFSDRYYAYWYNVDETSRFYYEEYPYA